MSKKTARAGGKFGGGHTTVTPASGLVADIASDCSAVTKISVGFIKSGLRPTKGAKRIKITTERGSLLLVVRDGIANQEIRVFATDLKAAEACIKKGSYQIGFQVT